MNKTCDHVKHLYDRPVNSAFLLFSNSYSNVVVVDVVGNFDRKKPLNKSNKDACFTFCRRISIGS